MLECCKRASRQPSLRTLTACGLFVFFIGETYHDTPVPVKPCRKGVLNLPLPKVKMPPTLRVGGTIRPVYRLTTQEEAAGSASRRYAHTLFVDGLGQTVFPVTGQRFAD